MHDAVLFLVLYNDINAASKNERLSEKYYHLSLSRKAAVSLAAAAATLNGG